MEMQQYSYRRLSEAIEFYVSEGAEFVDAQWTVSDNMHFLTTDKTPDKLGDEILVGSAEQSLADMLSDGELVSGSFYVACTPCFRSSDGWTDTHTPYFMKVELFEPFASSDRLVNLAKAFMSKYQEPTIVGQDLIINDIEVGSFGSRSAAGFSWGYCTGLAEPRFTKALGSSRGYHTRQIAKGTYGKLSKIQEELEELMDAKEQGNLILELVELSDVIGAVTGYLESNHPDVTLENLVDMARLTQRAFEDETRK